MPHMQEITVQFLGRTHDYTRVLRIDGEDYIVGRASGNDNNCLFDTLRQTLVHIPLSVDFVRNELAREFPAGPFQVRPGGAGNFLELQEHWRSVVRNLGRAAARRRRA